MNVEVRGLGQGYGHRSVLRDVSFTLEPGLTALIGINGAGKTTLLRTLIGDLSPRAGTIEFRYAGGSAARVVHALRAADNAGCGFLPQDAELPRYLTTYDLVAYAAWLKRVPRARVRERVETALARVKLSDRIWDRVGTLSGGMQRRVALAAAIVHEPELLILDEPTSGLDPAQRIELRDLLRSIAREHTVLVSTHILADIPHLDARLLVLAGGTMAFQGTAGELEQLAQPEDQGDSVLEQGFLRVSRTGAGAGVAGS